MQLIAMACLVSRTRMPLAYYCRTSFLLSISKKREHCIGTYIHVGSIRGIYIQALMGRWPSQYKKKRYKYMVKNTLRGYLIVAVACYKMHY